MDFGKVEFNKQGEVVGLENATVKGQKVRVTRKQTQYKVETQNRYSNGYNFLGYANNLYELKKIIREGNYCG